MTPTPDAPPEVGAGARRAVQWSLALLALTMLVLLIGPRWGLLSLVVAPATAAAMITALVMLRGVRLVALKVMLGVGIGVSVIALLYGLGLVVLREPVEQLAQCQERAITQTAQRQCIAEYEQAYMDLLERWGLTPPAGTSS
ncbi:hypothetical protein Lsed01_02420 [Demequina sediminis]|jgi:fatty acid desaturase|uniref:AI-2E family transporter n=1 Tax=Demequina sediminis TaxID=1930058 RepID=A0ABP9WK35_9MICO|nr:hypothetical protein [Demequina sediminis]BDZ62937.1 hypothetical protein GCM10025873_27280 [Demequina sediminis]